MHPLLRYLLHALLIFPLAAHATIVTTAADEDNGNLGGGTGISLREAVKYSKAGDTITFAPSISGQTIRLTLGEISIGNSINIDGSALPLKITLSGDKTGNGKSSDDTRILNITAGTVMLDSLILSHGCAESGSNRYGGAIHVDNTNTRLIIRHSTFTDNESTTYGGAIYFLGALNSPDSFLTLQDCILSGNYTGHHGGAIRMFGTLRVEDTRFSANTANQGCAIYNRDGSTTVVNSVFTGNSTVGGGYGGGIYNYGDIVIRRSTFSGNSANHGGGIYNINGTLTVENSTFTANTGTAIRVAGGTASVHHATIAGNSGSIGGGIYRTSGTLSVNSSIVAENTGSPPLNIAGTYTGSHNFTSGNPHLAPLGDYGGPTQTMPPLPGSPAISATSIPPSFPTDQRGYPRENKPDIGAVEYQGTSGISHFWKLDSDGDGSPYGTEQALGTDPSAPDSASSRNLTVPTLNASDHPVLSFGINSAAAPGTQWILKRSANLQHFQEIYRYDGNTDTTTPGVSFLRTATRLTITDTNSPPGGFYRFEAVLYP